MENIVHFMAGKGRALLFVVTGAGWVLVESLRVVMVHSFIIELIQRDRECVDFYLN